MIKSAATAGLHRLKKLSGNRFVRLVINLLVLGICAAYLLSNYNNIAAELYQVRIQWHWMVLSTLLTFIIVWTGAIAWHLLLLGFNQPVGMIKSCRVHLKSSVAKYIPGYAWSYLGKAYLTRQMGVSPKTISFLLVWEFAELIWSGLALGLLLIPASILKEWGMPDWFTPLVNSIGGILLAVGLVCSLAAQRIFTWSPLKRLASGLPILRGGSLALSMLIVIINWLLLGLCLWMTSTSLGYRLEDAYLFMVFSFSISLVMGILAIPVPNGLGVREGIMAYFLGHLMPLPVAVLLAAVSRLQIVAGDLISALIVEGIWQTGVRDRWKTGLK